MGEIKVGTRVVALQNSDDEKVYIFGEGRFLGDAVPAEGRRGATQVMTLAGVECPEILLDNGQIVYGCECHWGPVEGFDGYVGNREIVEVPLEGMFAEAEADMQGMDVEQAAENLRENLALYIAHDRLNVAAGQRHGRSVAWPEIEGEDDPGIGDLTKLFALLLQDGDSAPAKVERRIAEVLKQREAAIAANEDGDPQGPEESSGD